MYFIFYKQAQAQQLLTQMIQVQLQAYYQKVL
jgi:hypothetical protein